MFFLPQLRKSLEEHAEEEAIGRLHGISFENAPSKDFPQNWEESRKWAYERWLTKRNYAEKRLKAAGWVEACHQWLLEVLGHLRNRSPMARIALKYPTQSWLTGLETNAVYSSQKDWKLRGCRPFNHPKKRLKQYAQLIENCPNWMESLKNMDFKSDSLQRELSDFNRKNLNLKRLEKEFTQEVLGGNFGGTRVHTLMIDACLPYGRFIMIWMFFDFWFHWTAGDVHPLSVHGQKKRSHPQGSSILQWHRPVHHFRQHSTLHSTQFIIKPLPRRFVGLGLNDKTRKNS